MSTETRRPIVERLHAQFKFDWHAAFLIAVMLVVQATSLGLVALLSSLSVEMPEQTTDLAIGARLVGLLVVESLIIAGLWIAYKRLSERWQKVIRWTIYALIAVPVIYVSYMAGWIVEHAVLTVIACGFAKVLARYKLVWIVHNLLAVLLGIWVASALGFNLSPIVVLALMGALIVWDHFAVDLSRIMKALLEFSSSASIPNYLVVPNSVTIDMEDVRDWVTADAEDRDGSPDGMAGIIGLGDFVIPSALPVAAAVTLNGAVLSTPVIGAVAGTVGAIPILRRALEKSESGLPALPWLNTGAMAGYAFGVLASGIPILTALGVVN